MDKKFSVIQQNEFKGPEKLLSTPKKAKYKQIFICTRDIKKKSPVKESNESSFKRRKQIDQDTQQSKIFLIKEELPIVKTNKIKKN